MEKHIIRWERRKHNKWCITRLDSHHLALRTRRATKLKESIGWCGDTPANGFHNWRGYKLQLISGYSRDGMVLNGLNTQERRLVTSLCNDINREPMTSNDLKEYDLLKIKYLNPKPIKKLSPLRDGKQRIIGESCLLMDNYECLTIHLIINGILTCIDSKYTIKHQHDRLMFAIFKVLNQRECNVITGCIHCNDELINIDKYVKRLQRQKSVSQVLNGLKKPKNTIKELRKYNRITTNQKRFRNLSTVEKKQQQRDDIERQKFVEKVQYLDQIQRKANKEESQKHQSIDLSKNVQKQLKQLSPLQKVNIVPDVIIKLEK